MSAIADITELRSHTPNAEGLPKSGGNSHKNEGAQTTKLLHTHQAHLGGNCRTAVSDTSEGIEVWFEIETRCNLRCRFCYNYWKDGTAVVPQSSSTNSIRTALDLLFEKVGVSQITFSGGEPLLRPDLECFVEDACARNVPVIVATNGKLLTEKRMRSLCNAGVNTFQISFHSHDASMHDSLSGGPSWHDALGAIKRAKSLGVGVVPVFVSTKQNLEHFPEVVKMMMKLRIEQVIFNRFIPSGSGNLNSLEVGVPEDSDLIEVLTAADNLAKTGDLAIVLGTPILPRESSPVTWTTIDLASCPVGPGQRRWTLASDLSVRRCNQSNANNLGSLFDRALERVQQETQVTIPVANQFRSCSLLSKDRLVQISDLQPHTRWFNQSQASSTASHHIVA